ncbi:ATP synthase F1 subunit delta [Alicyclobacillus tengchongensis]|nr:ATP synthase F1 subunit delta [Alicyclobacillus tengchongensis]
MLSGAVVNRYARGLIAFAQEHSVIDEIDAQLVQIAEAIRVSKPFRQLLSNPILPTDVKLSTIERIVTGSLRDDVRRFLAMLLKRGRGAYVGSIASRYRELVDELHGRLAIDIETAQPLTEAEEQAIVTRLSQAYGKQIVPRVRENADLIAGYRIQVGNRVLDATTQNALRQFRERLLNGAVRKEGTR